MHTVAVGPLTCLALCSRKHLGPIRFSPYQKFLCTSFLRVPSSIATWVPFETWQHSHMFGWPTASANSQGRHESTSSSARLSPKVLSLCFCRMNGRPAVGRPRESDDHQGRDRTRRGFFPGPGAGGKLGARSHEPVRVIPGPFLLRLSFLLLRL